MRREIEIWWKQASRDLMAAQKNFQIEEYYLASFLSQQAIEKGLKALYIQKFNESLHVHNVFFLAKKVNAPQNIINCCKRVNPVYEEARYPDVADTIPYEEFSADDAKQHLTDAQEVLAWIEKQLK